jgi:signal peptidase I
MENEIPQKMEKESFLELVRFGVIALIIVIPIRIFIAQPFVVSGSSMVPTFENGDYLIVDELSYHIGNPSRGDVVIFRYPNDPKKFFIKRIMGLPNETVDIKGEVVTITNNTNQQGFVLDQPYIKFGMQSETHYELDNNEYFVMGDNRAGSSDSRYWGPVQKNLLVGKAFLRLFPIKTIDFKPGDYNYNQ